MLTVGDRVWQTFQNISDKFDVSWTFQGIPGKGHCVSRKKLTFTDVLGKSNDCRLSFITSMWEIIYCFWFWICFCWFQKYLFALDEINTFKSLYFVLVLFAILSQHGYISHAFKLIFRIILRVSQIKIAHSSLLQPMSSWSCFHLWFELALFP